MSLRATLDRALLYARTLRHLKPVQVTGRLRMKLIRPALPAATAAPRRATVGPWAIPAEKPQSLLGPARFRALSHEAEISGPQAWNDSRHTKLWLYNLHYFDDLAGTPDATRDGWRAALISRWIAENLAAGGNGWEPYPTSLRIVNWIKWALAGHDPGPEALASLSRQVRWLMLRLEWHLLGNHLFANAKALVFAGLFFAGDEADTWLAQGLAILKRELDEQILADGGHFERSPMYHAIILDDVLDLINIARAFGQSSDPVLARLPAIAARMGTWLAAMTHPDGGISFFNDAAFGIAPTPADLAAYAARLGLRVAPAPGSLDLAASGYARLARGPAVALIDCAAIGPDYLPGHAHADTLAFELSVHGARIVVNGGTSVYGEGPERLAERATAAHSTVEIAGQNSSEVWGGFRVARRARIVERSVMPDAGTAAAAHDGYARLAGKPVHRRNWRITDSRLTITDTVTGGTAPAIARFHLHPAIAVHCAEGARRGTLTMPDGRALGWSASAPVQLAASRWAPEFGVVRPALCLVVPLVAGRSTFELEWT